MKRLILGILIFGLSARSQTHKVTLSCDPVDPAATSTNIYRDSVRIGSGLTSPPCAYVDDPAPSGAHAYYVTALGPGGESLPSLPVGVTVPGVTPPPPTTSTIRINAGGPIYTDSTGVAWLGDTYWSGGSTYTSTHAISGTPDQKIYQSERWGAFTYSIPVQAGTYSVTLKFAETSYSATGKRVFNVLQQGIMQLSKFDIFKEAGGEYKAIDKVLPDVTLAAPGNIILNFTSGGADQPKIDGIIVQASNAPPPPPPHGPVSLSCDPVTVVCTPSGLVSGDKWSVTLAVDTQDGQHLSVAQTGVK